MFGQIIRKECYKNPPIIKENIQVLISVYKYSQKLKACCRTCTGNCKTCEKSYFGLLGP